MSNHESKPGNGVQSIDIDALTDLIESQLGNVVGGGYSQYSCCHYKTVDPQESQS
jgi:hypothetical protein